MVPNPISFFLDEKAIFVFGSNLRSIHGAGAALFAKQHRGASTGICEGLSGHSYALPTKLSPTRPLELKSIEKSVEKFLSFAKSNPALTFQVTRVGCGLAGYIDSEIAPMFDGAPENCLLPGTWLKRNQRTMARIIVAGSRDLDDENYIYKNLDRCNLSNFVDITIVSGMARGPDRIGRLWGLLKGYKVAEFPANWDRAAYGKAAGHIRNGQMAWYGTHLVAFWDGKSPGTKGMIDLAKHNDLRVTVIKP